MSHSGGGSTTSLVFASGVLALATLNLIFRFLLRPSEKVRVFYLNTLHLLIAIYLLLNDIFLGIVACILLACYPELRVSFRRSIRGATDERQLVADSILLYIAGTKWLLDAMGLSKLYMRPSLLLAVTLLLVVSLTWWTIIDSKKLVNQR